MNLCAALVCRELKECFPDSARLVVSNSPDWMEDTLLDRPLLYGGETLLAPDRIHVIDPARLPVGITAAGSCLIVCTAMPPTCLLDGRAAVMVVEAEGGLPRLFNTIIEVFRRYDEWDASLRRSLMNANMLDDCLTISHPVLDNPLMILDNDSFFLARVGTELLPRNIEGEPRVPPDLMVNDSRLAKKLANSREIQYVGHPKNSGTYMVLNIFLDEKKMGTLVMGNQKHPFRPGDRSLVRELAYYVALSFKYLSHKERQSSDLSEMMLQLLNGRTQDELVSQFPAVTSRLKGQAGVFHCLVAISHSPNYTTQFIANQLESALPSCVAIPFQAQIVLLCSSMPPSGKRGAGQRGAGQRGAGQRGASQDIATRAGTVQAMAGQAIAGQARTAAGQVAARMDDIASSLVPLFQDLMVTAGCSDGFGDIFELKGRYEQASAALSLGLADGEPGVIHHFRDHALEYLFRYGCTALPPRLVCAACVSRLAEHDSGSRVSYCGSLATYLDENRNMTRTAEKLQIRRSTCQARMERILRYVDLDLDDPKSRLYLRISLMLASKR